MGSSKKKGERREGTRGAIRWAKRGKQFFLQQNDVEREEKTGRNVDDSSTSSRDDGKEEDQRRTRGGPEEEGEERRGEAVRHARQKSEKV